eukprot:gnl/MRDRNA2_/MRDRNA2_76470_c0_seq1.p1 gnl/MRDRNA2_/MRDRNA2_76470_c0~~gnl/MRDRNA2_/MRDRNA2_76470_c0_seq1.p1  ORF type:complete len:763 (+),score=111.29 gnl/MRDRNA2_/MRDRNA2_76470_c0_seq1:111-2291(+)
MYAMDSEVLSMVGAVPRSLAEEGGEVDKPDAETLEDPAPRDTPILAFVFVCVSFMVFKYAVVPRYRKYQRKMNPDRQGEKEKEEKERLKFLFKIARSRQFDVDSWKRLPSEFLQTPLRTFDNFMSGDDMRVPPPVPPCTLQTAYKSVRRVLYTHVRDTVLHSIWQFVFSLGLFAIMISWWIRFAPIVYHRAPYSFFKPETVFTNLRACEQVHKIILPLASFSLALYINQRLAWFYSVMNLVWTTQGRLHDIALLVGASMPQRDDVEVSEALWMLYRHLNLIHFYTYSQVCTRFQYVQEDALVDQNLLLPEEAEDLRQIEGPPINKKNRVVFWVTHLIVQLISARNIQPYYAQALMDAISGLRNSTSTLSKEVLRTPPISFAQLLQLMVDGTNLLTPPALAFAFQSDRDGLSVYIWPALGSMIIALFYQGGLRLITSLNTPFEGETDELNPDWALMATDRKLFGYLTGSRVCQYSMPALYERMKVHGADHSQINLGEQHHDMFEFGDDANLNDRAESLYSESQFSQQDRQRDQDSYTEASASQYGASQYSTSQYGALYNDAYDQGSIGPSEQGEGYMMHGTYDGTMPPVSVGEIGDSTFDRIDQMVSRHMEELTKLFSPASGPADMQQPAQPWGESQRIVMDLVARFHEESRNVSQLRAELTATQAKLAKAESVNGRAVSPPPNQLALTAGPTPNGFSSALASRNANVSDTEMRARRRGVAPDGSLK